MATRLYITAKSPGTILDGPLIGDWSEADSHRDKRARKRYTFLLDPSATLGGRVAAAGVALGASTTKALNQKLIAGNQFGGFRWITKQLSGAGTLAGTADFIFKVFNLDETEGGSIYYYVYAYISVGDSLTQRTVLVNGQVGLTAWTSVSTWRQLQCSVAGAYSAGDRIVFEIGASASPPTTPVADTIGNMCWGTTNASDVVQADATNGSTAAGAAWLEFSDNLTFVADPAAPANDACLDAIVISSLPYNGSVYDTTQSLDADKAVWYKFVSTDIVRKFVTVRGSNYFARIQLYTGTCAGLSLVSANGTNGTAPDRVPWVGTAQSRLWFVPSGIGVTYFIKITPDGNGQYAAGKCGGALLVQMFDYLVPVTDDLFVNCQAIVCFRSTQPINWESEFYGLTPTGNAIDYTLRPLNDLNGGINTSPRLYIALFGDNPQIEILDLITLNVDQFEIDYITGPIQFANNGENLSTIVFDESGNIILGFYGNNYDSNGIPATGQTAYIRKMNGANADNQVGAPFAEATKYANAVENSGSDFTELSSDQLTMPYTSAGLDVLRWNQSTGQMTDFATLPAATGPRPGARSIRFLPNSGNGTNGALVAYGDKVLRLNSTGDVIQEYIPTQTEWAQDLDKIEITSDLAHFWVSDQLSTNLFKFNISSGLQTDRIITGLPPGQLSGFSIYNGYRAGITDAAPAFRSGLYELVPGKLNDTLYADDGLTEDVEIPEPSATSYLLGDE